CLDILRAIAKDRSSLESLLDEIRGARGVDVRFDAMLARAESSAATAVSERDARLFAELLAVLFEASLLIRHSIPEIADAFCATRLAGEWGHAFGTLPQSIDLLKIIHRAWPACA